MLIILKNSEYDQEIPQSQAADKHTAPRGRATQQSRDSRNGLGAKRRYMNYFTSLLHPRKKTLVTIFSLGHVWGP